MSFTLPVGWYEATIADLVHNTLPPLLGPLTRKTAWRYVYATAMFATQHNGNDYLHFVESDKLNKASGRAFAAKGQAFLDANLCQHGPCNSLALVNHIGRAYDQERIAQGHSPTAKRDPNMTGTAFEVVIQQLIEDLCGVRPMRQPELSKLRGFELTPVGYHSRPDLALFEFHDFRLLISTKWTMRKERIGTFLHEAYYYKRRRPDLQVAFVVSDYQANILKWLSQDPLADRVYHVNRDLLLHMIDPFQGSHASTVLPNDIRTSGTFRSGLETYMNLGTRLFDLSQLFDDIDVMK